MSLSSRLHATYWFIDYLILAPILQNTGRKQYIHDFADYNSSGATSNASLTALPYRHLAILPANWPL